MYEDSEAPIFKLTSKQLSKIPFQNDSEKQAILVEALLRVTRIPPKKCYYCKEEGFKSKKAYELHQLINHRLEGAYPSIKDCEVLGLERQYKPWEI